MVVLFKAVAMSTMAFEFSCDFDLRSFLAVTTAIDGMLNSNTDRHCFII